MVGKLFNTSIILANIYGPNWDNAQFFLNFFSTLPDLNSYKLILGGDFNCVLNAQLDRSSVRSNNTLSSAAVAINSFLRSPSTKQFSFFSPVHHSYSRIDYFIVDNQLLPLGPYLAGLKRKYQTRSASSFVGGSWALLLLCRREK